jgi:outer membrane protein assembly factor BamA
MKRSGLLAFCPVLSCLLAIVLAQAGETAADTTRNPTSTELLPIISYDPDAGFGYGVKVFALGHLGFDESFDLILFNSTKGERWYRLVVSLPDFERRQGAVYPLAIDLTIDYDKWIANSFFGIGNGSTYDNQETYTREPFEISLILSRAFSPFVICQGGMKYNTIRNFNFSAESRLANLQPALNGSRVSFASLYAALRYDTRNSYINPSCGLVALGECEIAPHADLNDVGFTRIAAWLQSYSLLSSDRIVFANRLGIQGLVGQNLPVQVLLPIGGNNTPRGTPQDRFLGKVGSVANSEIRFPIYWRFGGVVGFDAGKVWNKFSELDLARWATNPVAGLRFYMDTFVVRADVGFGSETTGFYLNFGHVF